MKKIIDFDPSLRTEIESGRYKVQTKIGLEATIIDWERKCYDRENDLVVKVKGKDKKSENVFYYYHDGRLISDSTTGPRNNDLVLVYEEEEKEETRTPFSQYRPALESGDLVAVTEFGEPVEIVKWNCRGKYPILAIIDDGDTDDSCFYDIFGVSMSGSQLTTVKASEVHKKDYPEGFIQTVCEYLDNFVEDRYFPSEVLEAAEKLLKASGQEISPSDESLEVIDFNVPLGDDEVKVKREVLSAIKNGKLSHVEIKAMTSNLRKLLTPEKPKEDPNKLHWRLAEQDSDFYIPQYVVRKSIFGKNKLVKTRRIKKGEYYCPIDKIYGNQSN